MRRCIPAFVVGVIAFVALVAWAPPTPSVGVTTHVAGSTVWVVWSVSSSGNPDSVSVTTTGWSTSKTQTFAGGSRTDSVAFARPAEGKTVSGTVTATPWKQGKAWAASASVPWSYTEPVTAPSTTVDSVRARPSSISGTPGTSVVLRWTVYRS